MEFQVQESLKVKVRFWQIITGILLIICVMLSVLHWRIFGSLRDSKDYLQQAVASMSLCNSNYEDCVIHYRIAVQSNEEKVKEIETLKKQLSRFLSPPVAPKVIPKKRVVFKTLW